MYEVLKNNQARNDEYENYNIFFNDQLVINKEYKINKELELNYRSVDNDMIFGLIANIYTGNDKELTIKWCEKIQRFVEVYYPKLKTQLEQIGEFESQKAKLLKISVLFMHYYNNYKDLRYLNTLLKIEDLNYIVKKSSVKNSNLKLNEYLSLAVIYNNQKWIDELVGENEN